MKRAGRCAADGCTVKLSDWFRWKQPLPAGNRRSQFGQEPKSASGCFRERRFAKAPKPEPMPSGNG